MFGDVAFQDAGFERNSLKPVTHISFRCEVPTLSVAEGQSAIMFKPHILKHHIPELPTPRTLPSRGRGAPPMVMWSAKVWLHY